MTTPVASTKSIRVAAVQTNVPQLQKFDAQFAPQVFDKFRRLSELAVKTNPPPDLLVWPESSMPDPARDPTSATYRFVTDFAAATKTDLMLGSLDFDEDRDYNAALLI